MNATNSGDIAWMLTSSAMVLLMTPGLAFFYGGMVKRKNIINTMMSSVFIMGLASKSRCCSLEWSLFW
jgi:Amt family ammonium transporter